MAATLSLRKWGRDTTSRGKALQTTAACPGWPKHNHPLAAPSATASVGDITQVLDRAATDGDFLQLPLSEEADVPAIGRPEWILCLFRSRQRLGIGSIERAEPQALHSIHPGGEDQVAPVG